MDELKDGKDTPSSLKVRIFFQVVRKSPKATLKMTKIAKKRFQSPTEEKNKQ